MNTKSYGQLQFSWMNWQNTRQTGCIAQEEIILRTNDYGRMRQSGPFKETTDNKMKRSLGRKTKKSSVVVVRHALIHQRRKHLNILPLKLERVTIKKILHHLHLFLSTFFLNHCAWLLFADGKKWNSNRSYRRQPWSANQLVGYSTKSTCDYIRGITML